MPMTLTELFESDSDALRTSLSGGCTIQAAMDQVEKALNRLSMRYMGECADEALREQAQYLINTLKDALPFMDLSGDVHSWKRDVTPADAQRAQFNVKCIAMLAVGAILILSGFISLGAGNPVTAAIAMLLAAGGGVLLFLGGRATVPKPVGESTDAAVRTEILVDADKLMHALKGMLLSADGRLETYAREQAGQRRAEHSAVLPAADVQVGEGPVDLMSDLLEIAYAQLDGPSDADAREMIAGIRYYLHGQGIELEDYTQPHRAFFEMLPSPQGGTMRPAMVRNGKLVKKGLAGE